MQKIKELIIGDLVAKVPIIQGGMGVAISLSGLASAVANQGGIGVIAVAGVGLKEPDLFTDYIGANNRALREELRKAKRMTKGIIGVNIMIALSNYKEMMQVSIEEGVDIIFSGAGLPLNMPEYLPEHGHHPKLVPIVSSGKAAGLIARRWTEKFNYLPDAIVVEGPKAGGHLGFKRENLNDENFKLETILEDVIKAIKPYEQKYGKKIPVIAAGGIYTGHDIFEIMKLGASGVQMATRFVTTHECDAADDFKKAYTRAKSDDILIINSPVGMPGRAIRNQFIVDVNSGNKKPFKCPYHCIITCDYKTAPYCIALALFNAKNGDMENGFAFAGENASRTSEIVSVKELMDELVSEYENS
ncbi:MAG: nitronate monooxygenase [Bacteroidota bacterium]